MHVAVRARIIVCQKKGITGIPSKTHFTALRGFSGPADALVDAC